MTHRTLRRIVGGRSGFKYVVEDIKLLGSKATHSYTHLLDCSRTKMRKNKGIGFAFAKNGIDFSPITEEDYYRILNDYKNKSVKVRKKSVKVNPAKKLADYFWLTDHFIERLKERFVNDDNGALSVIKYVYSNGIIIDPTIVMDYRDEITKESKIVIYEPDLRAVVIAKISGKKLKLITTYNPTNQCWFTRMWDKHKNTNHVSLKKYLKDTVNVESM